ncbi:cell division cycle-associated protein 2 [Brachionichthys hirsutus]|uniref:cell division cycle-associated protein 2 n=1 Tax=Brachionichthys hirsutus TaxID=412623 RepID=UPI0036046479
MVPIAVKLEAPLACSVQMESSDAGTLEDQWEKMPSSLQEAVPPVLHHTSAPLNFTELTPCQFGISVRSFIPAPASNPKDKTRLAQLKARRRSTIGVRGSPETNSLIRFMAQERMKTPPTLETPELARGSAFLPRVPSTLREKMASFQDLMNGEEREVCDSTPLQDSNTGGGIRTKDYLSDRKSHYGGKENCSSLTAPTPSKRSPLAPLEACQLEIRETSAPILQFTLKEQEPQEDNAPGKRVMTPEPLPSRETVEDAKAAFVSAPFQAGLQLQACFPSNAEDGVFDIQRTSKRMKADDPAAAAAFRPESSLDTHHVASPLEEDPAEDVDSIAESTVKNMTKRVRFGCSLSPEFFDKTLPPSTPLKKGATPARAATPGGSLALRSVLKNPQEGESQSPESHPDASVIDFGASPTLCIPHSTRRKSEGEDGEESVWKRRPETRSSAEAPARSSSRKRKLPEENVPAKRPTRSAAKSASSKIKMASTAKHQWNKEVDRSLYSTRVYVSKKPVLSTITESLSTNQSPSPSPSCTASDCAINLNPETTNTATNIFEQPSLDSSEESTTGESRKRSRTQTGSRGQKKRKMRVSGGILPGKDTLDQAGGTMEEHRENHNTANLEASREAPPSHTLLEQGDADTKPNAHAESDGKLECPSSVDVPPPDSNNTVGLPSEPARRKAEKGRRSSVRQKRVIQAELLHTGHEKEVKEQEVKEQEVKEQEVDAASQQEPVHSGADSREDGVAVGLDLAPWQADFNFEDVFKPVPTRGQRSVRRSLRNRCNADGGSKGAGLAWLPQTPPVDSKASRRKTQRRRLSSALDVQQSLPEETEG